MIQITDKSLCCGCSACASICPVPSNVSLWKPISKAFCIHASIRLCALIAAYARRSVMNFILRMSGNLAKFW